MGKYYLPLGAFCAVLTSSQNVLQLQSHLWRPESVWRRDWQGWQQEQEVEREWRREEEEDHERKERRRVGESSQQLNSTPHTTLESGPADKHTPAVNFTNIHMQESLNRTQQNEECGCE